MRSQHHHNRPRLHPAVKIDDVLVGQPYAPRRNPMSDPSGLVRPVDAIERVLPVGIKVEAARAHWVGCTAFDIVGKRSWPPLLTRGRRPSRPLFLAAGGRPAGPSLRRLTHD